METVVLSPKFQLVIPKAMRRALGLQAGQRMQVRLLEGKLQVEPEPTLATLKGRWPGLDTAVVRETDRTL